MENTVFQIDSKGWGWVGGEIQFSIQNISERVFCEILGMKRID